MQKARHATFYLLACLTIFLLVAWATSYHTAHQFFYNRWLETETGYTERAKSLLSNYGSLGVTWRRKQIKKYYSINTSRPGTFHQTHRASDSTFSNLHDTGILPWHWFTFDNASTLRRATPLTRGHLFIPYWSLFVPSLLAAIILYPRTP